jgi:hypothetical protein
MGLSRVRFTVRWMMGVVATAAVVAFTLIATTDSCYVGYMSVPLEFLILDASTGQPIEGASVRLIEGDPAYETTTGSDGRSKIVIRAPAVGRSRSTRVAIYPWTLTVTANRYAGVTDKLGSVMRALRYHRDAVPHPIVIRLVPLPGRM